MFGFGGFIASFLVASTLASPHLASVEVSGPRVEKTRSLGSAGIRRDSLIFSREPGAPMVRRDGLAARADTKTFSFEQTLEDQVIFNSTEIPLFPGPSLAVNCVKCCSKGGVEATFPGDFQDVVNPKFRVDLQDIEVYVEVDVIVSDSNVFSIPLLPFLPGLTGIELPGLKAGLFIDLLLVFQISGEADLRGGFYVKIPKGSFFEIDISEGAETSQEFTDVISKALPVTVNNDETGIEFKAALQLKAEFGISASAGNGNDDISIPGVGGVDIPGINLPDIGAGAMVGAFVNLVEYVANVAPEDDCALEATQELNLNMGVFAKFGINFEEEFLGLRPSATTTLLTLPLPTACILEAGLAIPTREALPPPPAECSAEATASSNDDEGEDAKATGSSAVSTEAKTTPAPSTAGEPPKEGEESGDKELTAIACASKLAECPDDLLTTITYKSSLCAAPAKTGSCFAVSDAEALEATSVVNTAPGATATANGIRADNPTGTGRVTTGTGRVTTGTGAAATGTAAPEEIAAGQEDDLEEDDCGEDSSEEEESTEEEEEENDVVESEDAPASTSDNGTADVSEDSTEESSDGGSEENDSEDTSADGSSAVTPPGPQPTDSPDSSSATGPEPESSDGPEPESTDEPEPENGPPEAEAVQTGNGSRLKGSIGSLAAAGLGFAAWVLV